MKRILHTLFLTGSLTVVIAENTPWGTAPAWWSQRGVINPQSGRTVDDFAVINLGQLKNLARAARDELNSKLAGGAGDEIEALIQRWQAQQVGADDFSVATVGQLKAVSRLFLLRLHAVGQMEALPAWIEEAGSDDFAVANIGQAKALFAFSVTSTLPSSSGSGFAAGESGSGFVAASLLPPPSAVTQAADGNSDGIPDADVAKFNLSSMANYAQDSLWQAFTPDDLGRPTQVTLPRATPQATSQVLTLDKDDNLTTAQ